MAKLHSSPIRRTHWTESDARRVLAEWERCGHTLEAFARSRGLVPQRLAWWRKRTRGAPQVGFSVANWTTRPCSEAAVPDRALRRRAVPSYLFVMSSRYQR